MTVAFENQCRARAQFTEGGKLHFAVCMRLKGHRKNGTKQPLRHYDEVKKFAWYSDPREFSMTPQEAALKIKLEGLRRLMREDVQAAHLLRDQIYQQVIDFIAYAPVGYSKSDLKSLAALAGTIRHMKGE